ncbi:hypothetical protein QQS21_008247 [Conoideocrella luteorostrata]|uniref:Ribosomal protein s17 n=1 Tax=Conoideocrella luteorostrata TaxID=1105319 RepID=A0AAJ0FWN9_9HYPO|nr:hypothetical protein QQS21_008247 [Conoideocrella luteorostrata]
MHLRELLLALTCLSMTVIAASEAGVESLDRLQAEQCSKNPGLRSCLREAKGAKRVGKKNSNEAGVAILEPDLVQNASQQDGNSPNVQGQASSAIDMANFINFCRGAKLTNGKQAEEGSCNGIPMGKIPATNRMISSIIVSPKNSEKVPAGKEFEIKVKVLNLAAGNFTNPASTYYSAPQNLNSDGMVIGHTHFTIQNTGENLSPETPLDPTNVKFFKGVNTAGDGAGQLSASVEGGLPAGNYRLCTLIAAANHQPVIMPVAMRGAQDDCIRFTAE